MAGSSVKSENSIEITSFCSVGPTKTGVFSRLDISAAMSTSLTFSAFKLKFRIGFVFTDSENCGLSAAFSDCCFAGAVFTGGSDFGASGLGASCPKALNADKSISSAISRIRR